jgi:hypothetical protein
MRSIVAIRTHKWTSEEERLLAALAPVFGDDVAVVFHNRAPRVYPPVPVIDLNAEWVLRNKLALVPDWGWRCGDYFFYALRQARPDYDHYWLIEPDVYFTAAADSFFSAFTKQEHDALGYQLGPFHKHMRFTRGLPGMAHFRAIFALTRFSGRALDRLFARRQQMAQGPVSMRDYPNDEIFAFSHIAADPELISGRLEDYAPDWFEDVQFSTDPDLLFDQVAATAAAGRVLHPVRGRAAFKKALSRRLAANTGLLMNIREAIDHFEPADVDDVVDGAAGHLRDAITELQERRALRRARRERLAKA